MVDLWLIFCISITFLTIIFHVVVDNVMHGQPVSGGSSVWANTLTKGKLGPTVVGPVGTTAATAATPGLPPTKREVLGQRVVLATKVMIPAVFFIFNICYWGYIMSQ